MSEHIRRPHPSGRKQLRAWFLTLGSTAYPEVLQSFLWSCLLWVCATTLCVNEHRCLFGPFPSLFKVTQIECVHGDGMHYKVLNAVWVWQLDDKSLHFSLRLCASNTARHRIYATLWKYHSGGRDGTRAVSYKWLINATWPGFMIRLWIVFQVAGSAMTCKIIRAKSGMCLIKPANQLSDERYETVYF